MVFLGKWPRPEVSSWAPTPENAFARGDHSISHKNTLLKSDASRWQKKKYNASMFRNGISRIVSHKAADNTFTLTE